MFRYNEIFHDVYIVVFQISINVIPTSILKFMNSDSKVTFPSFIDVLFGCK